MGLWRRDVLKAAGALMAALPIAELAEWPMGARSREAVAAGLPRVHPGDVPDMVVLNARVRTLDAAGTTAEALAVKAGRILAVGDTRTIRALAGPGTVQHDLAGLVVLPGFYDSHNHMRSTGLDFFAVDLSGTRSVAEVLQAIATRAATTPAGEWIVASSRWHESQLAEQRFPTRTELDGVAPSHPVWVPRGGHNRVVNSEAFRRAGITRDTPNPPGGTYVRDAGGELSGHIIGAAAFGRIARLLPRATRAREAEALGAAVKAYHAAGITSVIEPGLQADEMGAFQTLWGRNELTVRVTAMLRVFPGSSKAELDRALDAVRNVGFATGFGDEWLRLGGIKFTADGGVETSYLREPFAHADDPTAPRGKPHVSPENMLAVCRLAAELGWQMGVHCVGDAGIDQVLDAYAAVHATSSTAGPALDADPHDAGAARALPPGQGDGAGDHGPAAPDVRARRRLREVLGADPRRRVRAAPDVSRQRPPGRRQAPTRRSRPIRRSLASGARSRARPSSPGSRGVSSPSPWPTRSAGTRGAAPTPPSRKSGRGAWKSGSSPT